MNKQILGTYREIIKVIRQRAEALEAAHRARMDELNMQFKLMVEMGRKDLEVPDDWKFDQDSMMFIEPIDDATAIQAAVEAGEDG